MVLMGYGKIIVSPLRNSMRVIVVRMALLRHRREEFFDPRGICTNIG